MADPRAGMDALRDLGQQPTEPGPTRDLGLAPPPRRPPTPPPTPAPPQANETPPPAPTEPEPTAHAAAGQRTPRAATRPPNNTSPSTPPQPPAAGAEHRRSASMTIYLDAAARQALQQARDRDSDATVADLMLNAIRTSIGDLRAEHAPEPFDPDDPLPPPPRQRRRRHVADGRPVPVRLSPAERSAVEDLASGLGLSVSALVSAALARTT